MHLGAGLLAAGLAVLLLRMQRLALCPHSRHRCQVPDVQRLQRHQLLWSELQCHLSPHRQHRSYLCARPPVVSAYTRLDGNCGLVLGEALRVGFKNDTQLKHSSSVSALRQQKSVSACCATLP